MARDKASLKEQVRQGEVVRLSEEFVRLGEEGNGQKIGLEFV